jgi:hypothetical protein
MYGDAYDLQVTGDFNSSQIINMKQMLNTTAPIQIMRGVDEGQK